MRCNRTAAGLLTASSIVLGSFMIPSPVLAQDGTHKSSGATTARSQSANAQPPVVGGLEEVTVTARKRKEDLQSTPIAVSAVTEEQIRKQHVDTVADIAARLPNLQIFKQAAVGDVASTYLRGFGAATNDPSVDPPVAMYVNGIYIPQVNGSLVDAFDVAQIEVDRGPQGTLLGKNATVGAIVITTKKPTGDFDAHIQLDYGSYNYWGVRGRVDIPLIKDVLAMNLSFMDEGGGNYTYNFTTHKRDMGGVGKQVVRAGIDYTPNDRFEWWVTASGTFNRDPQNATRDGSTAVAYPPFAAYVPLSCAIYGHCTPEPFWTTRAQQTTHNHSETGFVSSNMHYRFDPVTVTFTNGFMGFWSTRNNDIDAEPQIIIEESNAKTRWTAASEELRIASNHGGGWDMGGRLNWQVGAYFFNEAFGQDGTLLALDAICPGGCPVVTAQKGHDASQAIYGHLDYSITPDLIFSFGARHTWDQKTHSYSNAGGPYVIEAPGSWGNTSFEAGLQYKFSDDKMAYFRFAQGYRGGGFIGTPSSPASAGTFAPETNNTYEIGAKTEWFDQRLRLNVDLFRGEYANLQKNVWIQDPTSATNLISLTKNVATATVQGVEVQAAAVPVPALNLSVNLGYLDPKYDSYFADIIGNGVPMELSGSQKFGFSPHFTADFSASYTYDMGSFGALVLNGDYNYRTHQYLSDVTTPPAYQPAYGMANASLEWQDEEGRYSFTVYGKNIFNKKYLVDVAPIALVTALVDGAPATWGITFRANL